jgi:stage II sporulation protein D (peptidoglycan lytic transglycosylase)
MNRVVSICVLPGILIAGWLYAQPAPVRVRLFSVEQPPEIRLTTPDRQTVLLNARKDFQKTFRSEGPVTIERPGGEAVRVPYPVEVSARNGTLVIVTELPLEDYVAAVLAGESSGFRAEESLKAMAVAARTYAVHFLNRHKTEGFDFCDTTHCQDFRITALNARLRRAVEATRNEVLQYDGRTIPAYYHQDCGGMPEPRAPYLRQLRDSFCVSRGRSQWSAELTVSDLQPAVGLSDVYSIEVTDRTASGRARRLRISGSATRMIDAETFRLAIGRTAGWNKIRSDLYDVRRSGNRFVFEGYGAGHGIGLCQTGAAIMGEQGYSYKEILAYYYPNTTLASSER